MGVSEILAPFLKTMYSARSFKLTEQEFNYLLPVCASKLLNRLDGYWIVVNSSEDFDDVLSKLMGLAAEYSEVVNPTIAYRCFVNRSLAEFRRVYGLTAL